jgi:hypothetical protein
VPATSVPISARLCATGEFSSWTTPATERTPATSSRLAAKTTDEWPRENQKPVLTDDLPSPTSLRVVLSIEAMWSASKAWRTPSMYAVRPTPTPRTPVLPSR